MDAKTCLAHINKTKRHKLAHRLAGLPESAKIIALQGWSAKMKPRSDGGGMIVLLLVNARDTAYPLRLAMDERTMSGEICHVYPLTPEKVAEVADMLAPWASPVLFAPEESAQDAAGAEGKPFVGWRGGRPRRVLTEAEKAEVDKARADGKTIDAIAKNMHISNRVISTYLKISK
jgi:hypothetical protein